MAVSADPAACLVTLETIRLVHDRLGLNITQGASNISFGLPNRTELNQAHTAISIWNGLTCPIANPAKITAFVRAVDLIRNRDDYAVRFVETMQAADRILVVSGGCIAQQGTYAQLSAAGGLFARLTVGSAGEVSG